MSDFSIFMILLVHNFFFIIMPLLTFDIKVKWSHRLVFKCFVSVFRRGWMVFLEKHTHVHACGDCTEQAPVLLRQTLLEKESMWTYIEQNHVCIITHGLSFQNTWKTDVPR